MSFAILQKMYKKTFQISFKDKTSENVITIDEILKSLKNKKAKNFYVYDNDIKVGGVCLLIDENTQNNSLELFYILEKFHSKDYDLTNNRKKPFLKLKFKAQLRLILK